MNTRHFLCQILALPLCLMMEQAQAQSSASISTPGRLLTLPNSWTTPGAQFTRSWMCLIKRRRPRVGRIGTEEIRGTLPSFWRASKMGHRDELVCINEEACCCYHLLNGHLWPRGPDCVACDGTTNVECPQAQTLKHNLTGSIRSCPGWLGFKVMGALADCDLHSRL